MKKAVKNQKHLSQEIKFLPSDYIMSSLDIADAAGMDHLEVMADLAEFGPGPIDTTGGYIALVQEDKSTLTERQCLLNLQAVLLYVGVSEFMSESEEIGRKILSRFFKLAANPSAVSTSLYWDLQHIMFLELESMQKFTNKLGACAFAARQAAMQDLSANPVNTRPAKGD